MESPRILIAPGPYKESLSSFEVAEAIREGIESILPQAQIIVRPLSDGGSGIAQILTDVTQGSLEKVEVKGPTGEPIQSFFGLLGDGCTAVIESAAAAGLSLIPKEKRNPLYTSTYGVGELISKAVERGAKNIIVGCGDSGTNDCGIGCAAALGVKFYSDETSRPLDFPTGIDLQKISRIESEEASEQLQDTHITVACNLTSILSGPEGTSIIYGPQKGASPEAVHILHQGVESFVELIYQSTGNDLSYIPGAGGAGGLAASLYAFFKAHLSYSIDVIDKYVQLDRYLSETDIVFTGEGRIDDRTATGKLPCGLALKAKKYNLPVIAIVGGISSDCEDIFYNGIDAVESISEGPSSLEESMNDAYNLIKRAAERVTRFMFKIPKRI